MMNKPQIGAAFLALSSCCPAEWPKDIDGHHESNRAKHVLTPTVEISPVGNFRELSVSKDSMPLQRKYRIPVPNPVMDQQQRLWDCIAKVDADLFDECKRQMAATEACYNEGTERIVDENTRLPECRSAQKARQNNKTEQEIINKISKESKCISVVFEQSPDILRELDPCFTEELSCLRAQISKNSLVCTAEDQEARYGI